MVKLPTKALVAYVSAHITRAHGQRLSPAERAHVRDVRARTRTWLRAYARRHPAVARRLAGAIALDDVGASYIRLRYAHGGHVLLARRAARTIDEAWLLTHLHASVADAVAAWPRGRTVEATFRAHLEAVAQVCEVVQTAAACE